MSATATLSADPRSGAAGPDIASAIYAGTLRHRRRVDVQRSFEYAVDFAYLDLDEIDTLAGGRLVRRLPGPWRFRRRDYLTPADVPLATAVRDRITAESGERPEGPVRMLTQLRCYGMAFNPVTLYYCFAEGATHLHSVLAEVTNTPWRERRAYVLGPFAPGRVLTSTREKALHVSPFLGMDQRYEIALTAPGATLSVHIDCLSGSDSQFDATLGLARQSELTTPALARLIRQDPVAPLRTLSRIYGQGFKLHRAGVAVRPHPRRGQR